MLAQNKYDTNLVDNDIRNTTFSVPLSYNIGIETEIPDLHS